jgi:hypothetical protein
MPESKSGALPLGDIPPLKGATSIIRRIPSFVKQFSLKIMHIISRELPDLF